MDGLDLFFAPNLFADLWRGDGEGNEHQCRKKQQADQQIALLGSTGLCLRFGRDSGHGSTAARAASSKKIRCWREKVACCRVPASTS